MVSRRHKYFDKHTEPFPASQQTFMGCIMPEYQENERNWKSKGNVRGKAEGNLVVQKNED